MVYLSNFCVVQVFRLLGQNYNTKSTRLPDLTNYIALFLFMLTKLAIIWLHTYISAKFGVQSSQTNDVVSTQREYTVQRKIITITVTSLGPERMIFSGQQRSFKTISFPLDILI